MTTQSHSIVRSRLALATAVAGLAIAGAAAAGCAAQGSAAAAMTNDLNAPVLVEVTEQSVAVQNHTGGPLMNVSIVLLPTQGSPFTKIVPRIDNQQRHEIAIAELKTSQGVAFSPTTTQPLKVLVSGSSDTGQRYEAEVPWR